jgi:hypothetical protein
MVSCPCQGYEDASLRTSANGQRDEEGDNRFGFRTSKTGIQIRSPSFLFLKTFVLLNN